MKSLFFAISRVSLEDPIEISPGLRLEPTYAYVFAHPMLAVKPPVEAGTHHPSPWTMVNRSGYVEASTVQLTVDLADTTENDALFKARTVVSLLRLLSGMPIRSPIFSKVSFEGIAGGETCDHVFEFEPPLRWNIPDFPLATIQNRLPGSIRRLEERRLEDNFSNAFGLLDSMWWIPSFSAQLIAIWSSAETLMQPGRSNMTKELARLVRATLGNDRSDGDRYYNEVIRLCAARGSAAHAGREPDPIDVQSSYEIVRALMIHSLMDRPESDQMEKS